MHCGKPRLLLGIYLKLKMFGGALVVNPPPTHTPPHTHHQPRASHTPVLTSWCPHRMLLRLSWTSSCLMAVFISWLRPEGRAGRERRGEAPREEVMYLMFREAPPPPPPPRSGWVNNGFISWLIIDSSSTRWSEETRNVGVGAGGDVFARSRSVRL